MTLGAGELEQVQAHISGAALGSEGSHRLVLHSYAPSKLDARGRPEVGARPIGSLQRSVSSEELENGLSVSLMQLGQSVEDAVFVAWVEPGDPVLELDARTARPAAGAALGFAGPSALGPVSIVLDHRA